MENSNILLQPKCYALLGGGLILKIYTDITQIRITLMEFWCSFINIYNISELFFFCVWYYRHIVTCCQSNICVFLFLRSSLVCFVFISCLFLHLLFICLCRTYSTLFIGIIYYVLLNFTENVLFLRQLFVCLFFILLFF